MVSHPGPCGICTRLSERVLAQAVKWQMVARNVADATEPPKAQRPPVRAWDQEQVRSFLTAAEGEPPQPRVASGPNDGSTSRRTARASLEDVDLTRGTLHVRRSLVELGSTLVFQEPKTKSGRRVVALGGSCLSTEGAPRPSARATLALGAGLVGPHAGITPTVARSRRET